MLTSVLQVLKNIGDVKNTYTYVIIIIYNTYVGIIRLVELLS